jgi:hypothetical protein
MEISNLSYLGVVWMAQTLRSESAGKACGLWAFEFGGKMIINLNIVTTAV